MILLTPDDSRDEHDDAHGPDSWVAVERYFDPVSAGLGQARLEIAGIEARVFDAEAGALGAYATGIGGIRLMVRASELEAARVALEADASLDLAGAEVPESEDILNAERYCSVCHSTDIEVGDRRTPADASLFMRLWDKVFGPAPLLRCRRCDHTWTE